MSKKEKRRLFSMALILGAIFLLFVGIMSGINFEPALEGETVGALQKTVEFSQSVTGWLKTNSVWLGAVGIIGFVVYLLKK